MPDSSRSQAESSLFSFASGSVIHVAPRSLGTSLSTSKYSLRFASFEALGIVGSSPETLGSGLYTISQPVMSRRPLLLRDRGVGVSYLRFQQDAHHYYSASYPQLPSQPLGVTGLIRIPKPPLSLLGRGPVEVGKLLQLGHLTIDIFVNHLFEIEFTVRSKESLARYNTPYRLGEWIPFGLILYPDRIPSLILKDAIVKPYFQSGQGFASRLGEISIGLLGGSGHLDLDFSRIDLYSGDLKQFEVMDIVERAHLYLYPSAQSISTSESIEAVASRIATGISSSESVSEVLLSLPTFDPGDLPEVQGWFTSLQVLDSAPNPADCAPFPTWYSQATRASGQVLEGPPMQARQPRLKESRVLFPTDSYALSSDVSGLAQADFTIFVAGKVAYTRSAVVLEIVGGLYVSFVSGKGRSLSLVVRSNPCKSEQREVIFRDVLNDPYEYDLVIRGSQGSSFEVEVWLNGVLLQGGEIQSSQLFPVRVCINGEQQTPVTVGPGGMPVRSFEIAQDGHVKIGEAWSPCQGYTQVAWYSRALDLTPFDEIGFIRQHFLNRY